MAIFKKGQKLYSILGFKCPKCHEGKLYNTGTFSYQKPFEMKDNCEVCGQRYVLEPGFYWGAMYMAYGLSSAVMLSGSAIGILLLDLSVTQTFAALIAVLLILYVAIFRMARSIWINLYVHYDSQAKEKHQAELQAAQS